MAFRQDSALPVALKPAPVLQLRLFLEIRPHQAAAFSSQARSNEIVSPGISF